MVIIQLKNHMLERVHGFKMNESVILTVNNVEIQINKYFAVAISQMIYNTYVLDNNTLKINIKTKVESQETYEVLKEILQYNKTEFECNDTCLLYTSPSPRD